MLRGVRFVFFCLFVQCDCAGPSRADFADQLSDDSLLRLGEPAELPGIGLHFVRMQWRHQSAAGQTVPIKRMFEIHYCWDPQC